MTDIDRKRQKAGQPPGEPESNVVATCIFGVDENNAVKITLLCTTRKVSTLI